MKVVVCTFDPSHTLDLARLQQKAIEDGTVAKACANAEGRTPAEVLAQLGILTMRKLKNHVIACPTCNMGMEELYAPDEITLRLEAIQAVCEDFRGAVERTRERRREDR